MAERVAIDSDHKNPAENTQSVLSSAQHFLHFHFTLNQWRFCSRNTASRKIGTVGRWIRVAKYAMKTRTDENLVEKQQNKEVMTDWWIVK